jgi:hypothetical protein
MLQNDMGMDLWQESIYAANPPMIYGLVVVKPVSCNLKNNQFVVEMCYPIVKRTDVYSLFQVKHRGAFNEIMIIFDYLNITKHIVERLLPGQMQNKVADIRSTDLGKCTLRVRNHFINNKI